MGIIQNPESATRIPHSFRFHAEIQYETQDCFNFSYACGDTLNEFLEDINMTLKDYKDREPKIVTIFDQIIEKDITDYFLSRHKDSIDG